MPFSTYIHYRHILCKYEVKRTVTGTHAYIHTDTDAQNGSRASSLSGDGGACTSGTYAHSLFHLWTHLHDFSLVGPVALSSLWVTHTHRCVRTEYHRRCRWYSVWCLDTVDLCLSFFLFFWRLVSWHRWSVPVFLSVFFRNWPPVPLLVGGTVVMDSCTHHHYGSPSS